MDDATRKHLESWLDHAVDQEEQQNVYDAILRALADEPDLVDRGYSWRAIADRGF